MYKKILDFIKEKPLLYTKSTAPFWDDDKVQILLWRRHTGDVILSSLGF